MTRKITSLILVLVLSICLAMSVHATSAQFVVDEFDNLATSEVDELNDYAQHIYEKTGVGIFFVFTETDPLKNYDIDAIRGNITDYVIMTENETSWYCFVNGKGAELDDADLDDLRDVYDSTETYVDGVGEFMEAAAGYFATIEGTPESSVTYGEEELVLDDAALLSEDEAAELNQKLNTISHKYNAQLIVCTLETLDGADIDEFDDYLYDTLGFGYGENKDGVLLLVSMDPREYRILSNGFAGVAIDTDTIDIIGDAFVSDLSDGNYADAFDTFADQCAYYLDGYINGFPFDVGGTLAVCLIIGVLAGVIVAFVLKGQLKSVRQQNQAANYVRPGSMQITVHNDFFLYRTVNRTRKESNSSSGSGSGGSARSSGGGSF